MALDKAPVKENPRKKLKALRAEFAKKSADGSLLRLRLQRAARVAESHLQPLAQLEQLGLVIRCKALHGQRLQALLAVGGLIQA